MWFDSWSDILRVILIGAASYTALIVLLRLTGKRSLSQLNAFDFVVTVALGSTLATILLSSDVSYLEGIVALGVLLALQLIVSLLATRVSAFRRAITAEPVLLVKDGELRREAMASARVTASEVHQVIRGSGSGSIADVAAVVLETNGKFSVIPKSKLGDASVVQDVPGF